MSRGWIFTHHGEITYAEWLWYKAGRPWRWLRGRKSY